MKVTYRWKNPALPRPNRTQLIRLARRATELAGLPAADDWLLSLEFTHDRAMARVNQEVLGHAGTTDVITFSYFDDPGNCFPGEIAVEALISADVARREGTARGDSSYSAELVLYIVHALLHAAGEDDLAPAPRRRMRRRESEVLEVLRKEFDFAAIFPISEEYTSFQDHST